MNAINLVVALVGAVLAYVFYFIGFRRGFRAGEKVGATTVVNQINGIVGHETSGEDSEFGDYVKDPKAPRPEDAEREGLIPRPRFYDELEKWQEMQEKEDKP